MVSHLNLPTQPSSSPCDQSWEQVGDFGHSPSLSYRSYLRTQPLLTRDPSKLSNTPSGQQKFWSKCETNLLPLRCALLPVVVVLAFIICWLPYHIGRNLFAQVDNYRTAKLSQNFNMASMVLTYLSASINPVVYNLMSRKYRAAAKRLFLLHHRPSQAHRSQRQFSVMEPISTLNESLTGV